MSAQFDYLTGAVTVADEAPPAWNRPGVLEEFYGHPNDDQWGPRLSRILYHESVHFWQLLSSFYMAEIVATEWARVCHFEKTGEILPVSEHKIAHTQRRGDQPFSPFELVECWARYWDVHTRSPERVIREEGLESTVAEVPRPFGYASPEYDLVMTKGDDCENYAAPYRWMLERMRGNSRAVAYLFPVIAHRAFRTRDPVTVFLAAFDAASLSPVVNHALQNTGSNINTAWISFVGYTEDNVLIPVFEAKQFVEAGPGFLVIDRGSFDGHPVFTRYPEKGKEIVRRARQLLPTLRTPPADRYEAEFNWILVQGERDLSSVFKLPGQPTARGLLGLFCPPPHIRFSNLEVFASKLKLEDAGLLDRECADVEQRVARFRAAETAVRLGLPADAFQW
ncbi:MAG TPA: hypothetical protein VFP86_17895 [bacterium]|nr:hypothetical protein [bacterium]